MAASSPASHRPLEGVDGIRITTFVDPQPPTLSLPFQALGEPEHP